MEVVGKLKNGWGVHWNHWFNLWYLAGSFDMKKMSKRCHNSYSIPSWLKKNENTGKETCRVLCGRELLTRTLSRVCGRFVYVWKMQQRYHQVMIFYGTQKNARSAVIRQSKFQSHTDSSQPFFGNLPTVEGSNPTVAIVAHPRDAVVNHAVSRLDLPIFWPWRHWRWSTPAKVKKADGANTKYQKVGGWVQGPKK